MYRKYQHSISISNQQHLAFCIGNMGDVNALEAQLRGGIVPIIGRIHEGKFLLDVRTLFEEDFPLIVQALREATE